MTSVTKKDKEFVFEFIRYYKLLPALWNPKYRDYHSNEYRNKSYMLLLKKYREHYPTASLSDLKKKVNSLRSNFRRYYRKQKPGETEPSLYWFNEMKFIMGTEEVENEIDVHSSYVEQKCEDMEVSMAESYDEQEEHLEDVEHFEIPETEIKYNWQDDQDSLSSPTLHYTKKPPQVLYKEPEPMIRIEDEFDFWGKVMAAELRKLDKMQQIFAKQAITNVLMEGQLGLLKRDSVVINKLNRHKLESSLQSEN